MAIGGVVINFAARTADAIRDVRKFTHELGKVDGASKKVGVSLKKGLAAGAIGVGAAIAGAGAALVQFGEAAVSDAANAARLERTLKNVTKATDKQVDSVEEWITAQGIAKGIADDKLRPALARLVRSTKSVGKAQDLATLAMDISAATGKDYNTVVNTLAKANDGQIVALKKLGITLGDTATNAQEYNKEVTALAKAQQGLVEMAAAGYGPGTKEYIAAQQKIAEQQTKVNDLAKAGIDWQKELSKEFAGQGQAQADSVQGTWDRIKLIFGEVGESIGAGVLPLLTQLGDWFKEKKNQKAVQDYITKVGDLSTKLGQDLVKAIQDVYAWLGSPDGQANIKTWTDTINGAAGAVKTLAGWLKTASDAYRKLPEWMRGNILDYVSPNGKYSPLNPKNAPGYGGTGESKPSVLDPSKPTYATKPGTKVVDGKIVRSSNVSITINNADPKRQAENAAMAARLARALGD